MSGDADIVERLRRWDDGRVSTHYDGCIDTHWRCAILFAADTIEELTAERDASRLIISDLTVEVERKHDYAFRMNALAEELLMEITKLRAAAVAAIKEARRG